MELKTSIVETHPDVAAQFHPNLNGDLRVESLTKGSTKVVWWLGDCGHPWDVPVQQRTLQGQGCPICKGKRVLAGVNDLAFCVPEIAAEWHPTLNGGLTPDKVTKGSFKRVWWLGSCGHEWGAIINDRVAKLSKCPICSNRKVAIGINDLATTHPDLASLWHPTKNGKLTPEDVTAGRRKPVHFICGNAHEWKGSIATEVKKANGYCPPCSGYVVNPGVTDLATLFPQKAPFWDVAKNGHLTDQISPESHEIAHWKCDLGHEFKREIRAYCKTEVPCPVCSGRILLTGFNDLESLYPELAKQWHPAKNKTAPSSTHPFSADPVWWQCEKGHEWATRTSDRIRPDGRTGCPECSANRFVSKAEQEVADFISSLGFDIRQSVRSLLKTGDSQRFHEVDIMVESNKILVEFNGLYYHSEVFRDSQYHQAKWKAAKEAGYLLIQVWEDDWSNKRGIVENMLRAKLGVSNGPRVFARSTTPCFVSPKEAQDFLIANHIQGHAPAARYHGLRDKQGILVALMATRMNKTSATISRYASNSQVIGGFTKLMAYVERELKPSEFVTFSDNCISDGKLYENSGFRKDADMKPDYSYFRHLVRHHKFNFRISRFRKDSSLKFEDGMSERQLATLNKIPRIWDAGKIRWVKDCA